MENSINKGMMDNGYEIDAHRFWISIQRN